VLGRLFICRLIVKQVNKADKVEKRHCADEKHRETLIELLECKGTEAYIGLVTHVYILEEVAESKD